MAVSTNSDTRLACGRDIDDVWDSIGRPPDEHQRQCPDCRRARESLAPVAAAAQAQRSADEDDPDLVPGPQVLMHVMNIVRSEVRRSRRLPLDEPQPDQPVLELTVSEQTVVAAARRAADAVPGVQVRRCRVELAADPPHPGDTSTDTSTDNAGDTAAGTSAAPSVAAPPSFHATAPGRVTVSLQISVDAGTAIPVVSREIRRSVLEAVSREVGMRATTIRIDVRDIHDV